MLSANPFSSRFMTAAFMAAMVAAFGLQLRAQDAPAVHVGDTQVTGLPDDWTHHHVFFSDPGTEQDAIRNGNHEHWVRTVNDPRYVIHQLKRDLPVRGPAAQDAEIRRRIEGRKGTSRDGRDEWNDRDGRKHKGQGPGQGSLTVHRDWSMSLAGSTTNGAMGAGQFPAKYNFSTSTAACSDYVAYTTGLAGSGTQATIIAYNSLYGGTNSTCGTSTTRPAIAWAYNTGGTALLSPVLSYTGDQVAYIQTVGTTASLVLLKWAANPSTFTATGNLISSSTSITITSANVTTANVGMQISDTTRASCIPANDSIAGVSGSTVTLTTATSGTCGTRTGDSLTLTTEGIATPGVLTAVTNANYRACTAPCFTTITLNGPHNDTNSAPYYDYNNDVMYVGDDSGNLHKLTGLFFGSPAEIIGGGSASGWPQAMTGGGTLTGPVFDSVSGNVYVGGSAGYLFRIPGGGSAVGGGSNNLVRSGLLVTAFAGAGIVDAPIVDSTAQRVYAFVAEDGSDTCNGSHTCFAGVYQFLTGFSGGNVGTEQTIGGNSDSSGVVYGGTFDNIYFNSTGSSPTGNLYVCGLSSGGNNPTLYRIPIVSNALNGPSAGLAVANAASTCSPVTEFYDGSKDWIFLSVTASGTKTGCSGACVYNFDVTSGATPANATAGLAATGGTSGIIIDNSAGTSTTTGESEVYYTTRGAATCVGNTTTGAGTHGCAVQASQSTLQ